jgi:hypothetical protein
MTIYERSEVEKAQLSDGGNRAVGRGDKTRQGLEFGQASSHLFVI